MSIEEIGASKAKTCLPELLERVSRGQVYRITKHGKPMAEPRPIEGTAGRPRFGSDRGRVVIAEDFDAPLAEMREYTLFSADHSATELDLFVEVPLDFEQGHRTSVRM